MHRRVLGKSGIGVSAIGLGCWSIGGPMTKDGQPVGWDGVDDDESIRALHRALDLGVTFYDTADVYGCGHSERLVGKAFSGQRDQVVIATKFGMTFDETTRQITGQDARPEYIRQACEASLQRLKMDYIDLYQFHLNLFPAEEAGPVRETLEALVEEGKIRSFGWSTNMVDRERVFADSPYCSAIQMKLSVLGWDAPSMQVCDEFDLASINKSPLIKGLLTGKFSHETRFSPMDVRHSWDCKTGEVAEQIDQMEKIRMILTRDGRTPTQGALGWLLTRSERTVPIPGFKTVAQVEENVQTMYLDLLAEDQMREIEEVLER